MKPDWKKKLSDKFLYLRMLGITNITDETPDCNVFMDTEALPGNYAIAELNNTQKGGLREAWQYVWNIRQVSHRRRRHENFSRIPMDF